MIIRNSQTGETREIDPSQASQYGITAPVQQANSLHQAASFIAPEVTKAFTTGARDIEAYPKPKNLQDVIPNALGKTGKFAQTIFNPKLVGEVGMQAVLGPLLGKLGIGGAKVAGKGAETAFNIARYPTKKIAAKATEKATQKATNEGVTASFDQLSSTIKDKALDKLGMTPEVKRALNKLIAEKTPAQLGDPKLSPNELLKWRRQISARGAGKGVLANLFKGTDIEDKVNSIARREISKYLHDLVPKSKAADLVYSRYARGGPFGGDIPQLVGKYGGAAAATSLGAPLVGSFLKDYFSSR